MVGGRAGQGGRTDRIARCIDARNVGLKTFIHLHVAAAVDRQLEPIEADPVQIRDASERCKHDVGAQFTAALQQHIDLGKAVEARSFDLRAAAVAAAHRAERLQKSGAQAGIEKAQRLGRLVEHRDLATQGREDRGVLAGDHAAAEYRQGSRQIRNAQDRIAVDHMLVIHLDGGDMARPRSGRDENARRPQHAAGAVQPLHLDATVVQKHALAANQFDPVARHLGVQVSVLVGDDGIDTLQERR